MTALWWTLIFGVAYPLMSIAVWSIGMFGISATSGDLRASARERALDEWSRPFGGSMTYVAQYSKSYYISSLAALVALTLIAGILWPIAIPMWIGWRKGSFISSALAEREQIAKEYSS